MEEKVVCPHCDVDQLIDTSIFEFSILDRWEEVVICANCDKPFTISVKWA